MLLSRSQFQQQSLEAISRCFSSQENPSYAGLQRLMLFCPNAKESTFVPNATGSVALKAICDFLFASRLFADEIIAWLIESLQATSKTSSPSRSLEEYVSCLVQQLGRMCLGLPTHSERITHAVIYYFGAIYQELKDKDIRDTIYYSLLFGFLEGFAHTSMPWSGKQTRAYVGSLNALIKSKIHVTLYDQHPKGNSVFKYIIGSLFHLLSNQRDKQQSAIEADDYRAIYQLCAESLGIEKKSSGVNDGNVLGILLDLLTECGVNQSDLTADTFDLLIGLLRSFALFKVTAGDNNLIGLRKLINNITRLSKEKHDYLLPASNEIYQLYHKINAESAAIIRPFICDGLSVILKKAIEINHIEFIRGLLTSISNLIPMRGTLSEVDESKSITDLLADLTVSVNDPLVSSIVLPIFVNLLSNPSIPIDRSFMRQLSRIAVLEHGQYCIQTIAFLCEIYAQQNERSLGVRIAEVPAAFCHLASGMKDLKLREELRLRLLNLCQSVCHGILVNANTSKTQITSQVGRLGVLLSPLADLIYDAPADSCVYKDTKFKKTLRNLWIYMTVFGLMQPNAWVDEWEKSIRKISVRIPPLTSKESGHIEEVLLEISTIIAKIQGDTVQNVKNVWSSIVNSGPPSLKLLTLSKSTYLLAIYYVEVYRSGVEGYKHMMSYLVDSEILDDVDLEIGIKHIADLVFQANMQNLRVGQWTEAHQTRLEEIGQNLIIHHAARIETARLISQRYMSSLLKYFPQVTMSRLCLQVLLDLTEKVAETKKAGRLKVKVLTQAYSFEIEFPDEFSGLDSILDSLSALCKTWVGTAHHYAPEFSKALLQDHMCTHDTHEMYEHHQTGYSLSVALGFTSSGASGELSPRHKGSFVTQLETKVKYISELRGMMNLLHDPLVEAALGDKNFTISRTLISRTLTQIKAILNKHKSGTEFSLASFEDAMCRLASLIIMDKTNDISQLIHALCWSPVYIFTENVMRFAVFVWTWILASRPDLSFSLLSNVAGAWNWTVGKQYGIFNQSWTPEYTNPYSEEAIKEEPNRDPTPHSLMLSFLVEQFEVGRLFPFSNLQLFHKVVSVSLSKYNSLSLDPEALGARIQLLDLSLRLYTRLYSNSYVLDGEAPVKVHVNSIKANIFIGRILAAGLKWFCIKPQWQDINDSSTLIRNLRSMNSFAKKLQNMSITCSDLMTNINPKDTPFLLTGAVLSGRKDLLVLLISNEVDRILVWYNPRLDPKKSIADVSFSNTEAEYQKNPKTFVNNAWRFSPSLALYLCERFTHLGSSNDLEHLVRAHPYALVGNSDVLSYIISETSARKGDSLLEHLLLWSPTTPPRAIQYLIPPYSSNMQVYKYAVRSLKTYSAKTILFYVPQLMQLLRYDTMGILEDFLVSLSLRSDIFAHRLLWNIQTIVDDETQRAEPGFIAVVDRVRSTILQRFSAASKDFYQKEISFFGEITAISGMLKPLHPDKRKGKISEELRKISIPTGVYLPTNPESTVVGINPDNPVPLKSHSRVPILVTFKVSDSALVEDEPESEARNAPKVQRPIRSQGCIFKVDDDVRQDVLATQIIALYKTLFQKASLDVFLAPYKVIATGKNMGVIEVVPNASSRDMLGKNSEGSLYNYFLHKYGHKDSVQYATARHNFISSMAAYAVVSYILQVKDRHNGNILVDEVGHIVHIDFGFMFDSSPGGNANFERAPFKLALEMVDVMGGSVLAEPFCRFAELCVRCYLVSRQYMPDILSLVRPILPTKLPCFRPKTMKNLESRFVPRKSEREAAAYMLERIQESSGRFSTYVYDQFQAWQNDIDYAR